MHYSFADLLLFSNDIQSFYRNRFFCLVAKEENIYSLDPGMTLVGSSLKIWDTAHLFFIVFHGLIFSMVSNFWKILIQNLLLDSMSFRHFSVGFESTYIVLGVLMWIHHFSLIRIRGLRDWVKIKLFLYKRNEFINHIDS